MDSRESKNFEAVFQHLEKHQEIPDVWIVTLGKQKFWVQGTTILKEVDSTPPKLLPTELQKLENIVESRLGLARSDSVNAVSRKEKQRTALIKATLLHETRLVKVLLDYGADPTVEDENGDTAILHAAREGFSDILQEFMLLIRNANKDTPDDKARNEVKSDESASASRKKEEFKAAAAEHKSPPEKPSFRVQLKPDVLWHANKNGETAEGLVRKHLEQHSSQAPQEEKKKTPSTKPRSAPTDPLERLRALAENMQRLRPGKTLAEKELEAKFAARSRPKTAEPVAKGEADEIKKAEEARQERLQRVQNQYNGFYRKQYGFFAPQTRALMQANTALVAAQRYRENLRNSSGLILYSTDKEPSLDELRRLSQAHNYEPILIKRSTKQEPPIEYSIFGLTSFNWGITTLSQEQGMELEERLPLVSGRLNSLEIDHPHYIPPGHYFFSRPELRATLDLGHKPALNRDRRLEFKLEQRYGRPVVPTSSQDQASVHAVMRLLWDYSQPECTLLPNSLECGTLRRLLTCNLGRRYCKEAESFYHSLDRIPLDQVDGIMQIYYQVKAKLHWAKSLKRNKKENNTIFNSSFTSRLHYILLTLQNTDAYRLVHTGAYKEDQPDLLRQEVDAYLNQFDIKCKL